VLAGRGRGRTWAFGPVKGRTVRGNGSLGACSGQLDASYRIPPLGLHVFDRGSEPSKSQRPSGRADLRSAPARLDRSPPSGGRRDSQAGMLGLPGTAEERQARTRFAPP
jgi:hypothetical protein